MDNQTQTVNDVAQDLLEQIVSDPRSASYLTITDATIAHRNVSFEQTVEQAVADIEDLALRNVTSDLLLLMRLGHVIGMAVALDLIPVESAQELREFVSELFVDAYSG